MKSISEHFDEEAKNHENHFVKTLGMSEFYDEIENQIAKCTDKSNILVIGCGTGLEIERIKCKANVVAVDISKEMIRQLENKRLYSGITLVTVCKSILDMDFGMNSFDVVLTCYTMHHFTEEQKTTVYNKIYGCLVKGGCFINGDIMAKNQDEEDSRYISAEKVYSEKGLPFGSLHIDIPLYYEHELIVLEKVGFHHVTLEREWGVTKLYRAYK